MLLLASRRSDESRRRKTAGNIADGLRCCIWRRAEKPEKMRHHLTWGGKNSLGYIALLHPSFTCSRGSCNGFSRSSLGRIGGPSHCSPGSTLATTTSWELNSSTASRSRAVTRRHAWTVSSLSRPGPQTTPAILEYQPAEKIRECACIVSKIAKCAHSV